MKRKTYRVTLRISHAHTDAVRRVSYYTKGIDADEALGAAKVLAKSEPDFKAVVSAELERVI